MFNITNITVLITDSTDDVIIKTDFPDPIVVFPHEKLSMRFKATKGTGVRKNFNIEPTVINISSCTIKS
jgi:hypothetical protein